MQEKNYIIFNVSELSQINFDEVYETSIDTVRKSIDQTLTFVKYDADNIPESVSNLTTKQGPYSQQEILSILGTPEWTISDINP